MGGAGGASFTRSLTAHAAGSFVKANVAANCAERFSSVVGHTRMENPQPHPVLEPHPRSRRRLAGPESELGQELESGSLIAVETK